MGWMWRRKCALREVARHASRRSESSGPYRWDSFFKWEYSIKFRPHPRIFEVRRIFLASGFTSPPKWAPMFGPLPLPWMTKNDQRPTTARQLRQRSIYERDQIQAKLLELKPVEDRDSTSTHTLNFACTPRPLNLRHTCSWRPAPPSNRPSQFANSRRSHPIFKKYRQCPHCGSIRGWLPSGCSRWAEVRWLLSSYLRSVRPYQG